MDYSVDKYSFYALKLVMIPQVCCTSVHFLLFPEIKDDHSGSDIKRRGQEIQAVIELMRTLREIILCRPDLTVDRPGVSQSIEYGNGFHDYSCSIFSRAALKRSVLSVIVPTCPRARTLVG
ncbi:hypothetical protein FRC12_024904 [Ceratobasidium sp. 428]|nr:hypothetical protein FRC12_024904 [Ceratobasidium sp. 428]